MARRVNPHGEQQTASQAIAAALTRRVVAGRLEPGTKLPTERDLAQEFGVARHIVREALKRLEAVGLVRIRQGSGIFVQSLQLSGGIELFDVLLAREDGSVDLDLLREILEFREHTICAVVRLAAQRRTPEEMQAIRDALARRNQTDAEGLEQATIGLFGLIASASHNRIYELVSNTTGHAFMKLRAWVDIPLMGLEQTRLTVERVVEAIDQQDPDLADRLVARYLDAIRQALFGTT